MPQNLYEDYLAKFSSLIDTAWSVKAKYDTKSAQLKDNMDVGNAVQLRNGVEDLDRNQLLKLDAISDLLLRLINFSTGQFDFFREGFIGNSNSSNIPNLHPEVAENGRIEYTPEFVLASIIKQTSADLTILQNAAEQRLLAFDKVVEYSNINAPSQSLTEYLGPLDFRESDGKASMWLWNTDEKAENRGEVITYLTDSIRVRVTPYSQAALVAIPYHWRSTPQGLNAIAHEIGHLRYWLPFVATPDELKLFGRETNNTEFVLCARELYYPFGTVPLKPTWTEEIFADVYSVWIGGKGSISTGMDVALEHSFKELTSFDLEASHPSPLIRPLLLIKAFERMKRPIVLGGKPLRPPKAGEPRDLDETSMQLFDDWKTCLQNNKILYTGKAPEFTIPPSEPYLSEFIDPKVGSAVGQLVDWNSLELNRNFVAERLVEDAIVVLYNLLEADTPKALCTPQLVEDARIILDKLLEADSPKVEHTPQLVEDALVALCNLLETDSPRVERTPRFIQNSKAIWQDWMKSKGYFADSSNLKGKGVYAGEFDKVMDPRTRGKTDSWLPIFGSGGWNTEGTCGSPGKPYD